MSIVLEIAIGLLLLATCAYCVTLGRKLERLRKGQADLLTTIERFDEATRRAESNLNAMQSAGAKMNRDLGVASTRASALIDELSVMVHAGDGIAGRIEGAVREVRAIGARPDRLAS